MAQVSQRVITVRELNAMARGLLESNLPLLWVGGEVSNFTRATSGHWYFSLKDSHAQVRCVMFRHKSVLLDFLPENGMQIEVRALPTLYETRGDFQLGVETMRRAGLGALYEAFEKLKKKLESEGLFETARKRPLPAFPSTVGVVTSLAGAALRDVLTTLARRWPGIRVIVYPAPVQGDGAALRLAHAVQSASLRQECEVLIVCRGGGSFEDLWPFNDEALARNIAQCSMPVVSGVGHETDFTIVDFVADARAPTPTAAAELVSPDCEVLRRQLERLEPRIARQMRRKVESWMQRLDYLGKRLVHPGERIHLQRGRLDGLRRRARLAVQKILDKANWRARSAVVGLDRVGPQLAALLNRYRALASRLAFASTTLLDGRVARLDGIRASLAHLNPHAVLERGYSLVWQADGQFVRDSKQVRRGEQVRLQFSRGEADAEVKGTRG